MISTLTFQNGTKTGVLQDGVKIANPSSYKVTMADIDLNSQRATSGTLNRNRVRTNVFSIECTWDWLSDTELDKLLAAMQAAKFTLTFRNPLQRLTTETVGGYTTIDVYAEGTKTAELITTEDEQEDYWKFSCTFIEF